MSQVDLTLVEGVLATVAAVAVWGTAWLTHSYRVRKREPGVCNGNGRVYKEHSARFDTIDERIVNLEKARGRHSGDIHVLQERSSSNDSLIKRLEDREAERHGELKEGLARIESKVDGIVERNQNLGTRIAILEARLPEKRSSRGQ